MSWNCLSFRSTTVWPRWISGAVGSTPRYTRKGLPVFADCSSLELEFILADDFGGAFAQVRELFFNRLGRFDMNFRGMPLFVSPDLFGNSSSNTAAVDTITPFQDDSNRIGVDAVLFAQDSLGQGFRRVLVFYRDAGLQDDRAGVEIFVHEMHGAAGKFRAVFQGLALRFEAGKGGQQRRMNIQDAIWKGGDEIAARAGACSPRGRRDPLSFRATPRRPACHRLHARGPSRESPATGCRGRGLFQFRAHLRDC